MLYVITIYYLPFITPIYQTFSIRGCIENKLVQVTNHKQ